jgi:hypothetical protein
MKKPKDLIDELLAGCKTPADIAGEEFRGQTGVSWTDGTLTLRE